MRESFPEVERSTDEGDPHIILSLWSQDEHARVSRRFEVAPWAGWLAELPIDLEVDEVARLHMVEALRRSMTWRERS